tara:strand:+ start:825 stop:1343 length:519 start_codon:yes stop_codon:yes gene_type:complete
MKTVEDLNLKNQKHYKIKMDTGITEKDRSSIADGLSRILADSYSLMISSHNYHWNVRGKNFRQIHLLTEEQYTDLFGAVDEIAERIRSLGFIAPGSFSEFKKLSDLNEPNSKATENEMLADLLSGHEHIAKHSREVVAKAAEVADEATADLLTARINVHEKSAWMLRSMLEE